jgi:hypothetical protein
MHTSMIYDVKFEIQDQQADYSIMKMQQIFNHFPNNSEVTTKAGLARNLYRKLYIDLLISK